VKVRAFFIAALFLSLTVHGLVLFTPSRSVPKSVAEIETYRVNLARMPARNVDKEEPVGEAISGLNQEKPESPDDYQHILDELNRLLRDNLHYPETARRKGIEGSLEVTFILNTDGEHLDMVVSEPSGSRLLDRAALRAISAIFPYPDPPDTPLRFTIPVTYRLTGSE
jgi:TonB family protein